MKLHKLLFFAIVLFNLSIINAQSTKIDTIYQRLQDSIKFGKDPYKTFLLYDHYSVVLENHQEYDKSHKNYYNMMAYVKNNLQGRKLDSVKAAIYTNLSFFFAITKENDSSIINAEKAIKICENNNFYKLIAKPINNKANALGRKGKVKEAVSILLSLDKSLDKLKDTAYRDIMKQRNLHNVGFQYLFSRNFVEAEKIYKKCTQDKYKNNIIKTQSLLNLSAVYLELKKPKKALETALKADSLLVSENYSFEVDINLKSNIASSYLDLGEFEKAIKAGEELLKLAKKMKLKENIIPAYLIIGKGFSEIKNYKKGLENLKEGYRLAKKSYNPEYIMDATENISELYANMKKFDSAYVYKEIHYKIVDSLDLVQKNKDISDVHIKYESLKKEKQISEQNLELQTQKVTIASQRNTQLLLIGGLGFLVLGGLLFYNRNKAQEKQKLQEAVLKEKEKGFASVIKASEDERKRISKDLHDGIGQQMSALKMALSNVKEQEADATQKEQLLKILNRFTESADEIRHISHQMMPKKLLDNGLPEAIEDLLFGSFEFSNIKYEFEYYNVNERFDERIEISLYRVLQELINNIIKHANATEVNVLLNKTKDKLVLFVEDNGVGMKEKDTKGHGVLNIKSRIDMVKGTVNYEPSMSSGTTATITIPL